MAVLTRGAAQSPQQQVNPDNSTKERCDNEQPLPQPQWGSEAEPLEFSSFVTLQIFLKELGDILRSELKCHPYNTVGSFLAFYDAFLKQGRPLEDFYHSYQPSILPESLSCVGLGYSLINSMRSVLDVCYPELKSSMFLASCEEMIADVDSYVGCSPSSLDCSVKEHVLVVVKIMVEEREGYILMDPGYHVNIPVVVMADSLYPNTGWFLLSETAKSKKEYCYEMDEGRNYVKWSVKETRNGKVNSWTNLIYVRHKFLSAIDVAEKRNIVFNFRTIVSRNCKHPVAGLYCNLEGDEKITFFYNDQLCHRQDVKIPFEYFQGCRGNNHFECAISACAAQIGYNDHLLSEMINHMIEAYFNVDFMPFVRLVNRKIDE